MAMPLYILELVLMLMRENKGKAIAWVFDPTVPKLVSLLSRPLEYSRESLVDMPSFRKSLLHNSPPILVQTRRDGIIHRSIMASVAGFLQSSALLSSLKSQSRIENRG